MMNHIWSGRSKLWIILWPCSVLYGVITWLIKISFKCGWRKRWRAKCPVVVVGNLTVGGNGKTPVVIWLIQALQERGLRIGVVSRGYGGKAKRYPLLVTEDTSPSQAGDEPVMIAQRTQVPVAVAPNRYLAAKALLDAHDIDVIVTDDGLQHYALHRDIEIVVIDGVRRFGNGWLLPAGPMRERVSRLSNVDAIIVNGGHVNVNNIEIAMTIKPGLAINLLTGKPISLHKLPPIVAMAGIGYPPNFFNMIKKQGINPIAEIAFTDHYVYSKAELHSLTKQDQCLLMTEKDAVKCRNFAQPNWWYLLVDAHLHGSRVSTLLADIVELYTTTRDVRLRY
ncbi:tetraacyldisaccharide 4'-kinase [Pantoea sp. Aalb]|uniref:tetraacyldisaccharide 4'-kinase n=1 Tax=Pantoea sp. Aalb TaxID=2576762 RepID=UPI001328A959|nr:tetraacyldisaccharide 4'-kinase [Pantoea sp. Aalb]MXP67491.1 tetraacyldisaccharide 4'-kinase [Pantoea sp. Aalb]